MSTRPELPTLATVDGQAINLATLDAAVRAVAEKAEEGRGFTLFTFNLDHAVKRRRDQRFRDAYARATFVSADGAPIVAMARRRGAKLDLATGADIVVPLCAEAARRKIPVYFFGSTKASLQQARHELEARFPGLVICGAESPAFGFDPSSAAADAAGAQIARSGARICFVALGAPKQELFSDRMLRSDHEIGFVCVGAALDFISGAQRRAPEIFRRSRLEWLWRFAGDPRRLALRYGRCIGLLADLAFLEPLRRRTRAGQ